MCKSNPVKLLLQALVLAAVSLVASAGSAFAHGGGAANYERLQAHAATTYTQHQQDAAAGAVFYVERGQTNGDDVKSAPCRGESSGHVAGVSCCSISCHAALAVPAAQSLGVCELLGARIGLSDLLEGRSNDRTERPPKLS